MKPRYTIQDALRAAIGDIELSASTCDALGHKAAARELRQHAILYKAVLEPLPADEIDEVGVACR